MDLTVWASMLERFGLPLAMLLALGLLLLRRRSGELPVSEHERSPYLVPGSQVDDLTEELAKVRKARDAREFDLKQEATRQIAYVEMLRIEQQTRANAAEERLAKALERLDRVAEVGQRQLEELIRGKSR